MKIDRFITCERQACGAVKQVRNPYEQRTMRFCSRKCAGMVLKNITKIPGANSRGGLENVRRRRLAILARLEGMTVLEAFRLGYNKGLFSKIRQRREHRRKGQAA